MEREINIKYLIQEIMRNLKWVILVGIVLAVVLGTYSWLSGAKQITATGSYASFAKLSIEKNIDNMVDLKGMEEFIERFADYDEEFKANQFKNEVNTRINETIEEVLETQDNTEKNIAFLTSDRVLEQVASDGAVKKEKLSAEEIREMLYLRGKEYGSIVEINVVAEETDSNELSDLICSKVIEYGSTYMEEMDYIVEITQDTTALGPVTVELRESTVDPRDKRAIITPTEAASGGGVSMMDILKKAILGLLAGVFLACVYFCIRFIIRDRILYAKQLEEGTGIKLISDFSREKNYWELYSNLTFGRQELFAVNFISLKKLKEGSADILAFAEKLGQVGKKVLVLEYMSGMAAAEGDSAIESRGQYSYGVIGDNKVLDDSMMKETIDSMRKDYDFVLFFCDGTDQNPVGRLLSEYADRTVLFIESDTVKTGELITLKNDFDLAGCAMAGAVFVG